MLDVVLQSVIVFSAAAGLAVSAYVRRHKRTQTVLVCPLHANCETVVHSEFSHFLGIPVELIGVMYYGLLMLSYAFFLAMPDLARLPFQYILLIVSTSAFLFSVYLTFIQVFTLRQYCSWCLLSASLSTIIFFASFRALQAQVVPILAGQQLPLLIFHLLGLSLGMGGAIISDLLFFKFLKDWRISAEEDDILRTLSQVIWLALAFLVISGAGMYLPEAATLNQSGRFLIKISMVGILIVNGALLNLLIAPKLRQMFFGADRAQHSGTLLRLRKLAFALGAISILTWFSVLVVATLPRATPALPIAIVYSLILLGAIIMSQFIERRIGKSISST